MSIRPGQSPFGCRDPRHDDDTALGNGIPLPGRCVSARRCSVPGSSPFKQGSNIQVVLAAQSLSDICGRVAEIRSSFPRIRDGLSVICPRYARISILTTPEQVARRLPVSDAHYPVAPRTCTTARPPHPHHLLGSTKALPK